MDEIKIKDLCCEADGNEILKGVNLNIKEGDCIALLGPNGHGKSTLLNAIMGSPQYKITSGSIFLNDTDLLSLSVDQKSKQGLFMAFQNPPEVPGVVSMDFFRASINAHMEKPASLLQFYKATTSAYEKVGLDSSMASRHLNEGYSGGEKKRNEILQMLLLKPKFAFLDEIDSGLDVDALNQMASIINELKASGTTFVIISHYEKLYEVIKPNRTAVIVSGKVAIEGGYELADRISHEGYSILEKEYHISIAKEEKKQVSIGECSVKQVMNK